MIFRARLKVGKKRTVCCKGQFCSTSKITPTPRLNRTLAGLGQCRIPNRNTVVHKSTFAALSRRRLFVWLRLSSLKYKQYLPQSQLFTHPLQRGGNTWVRIYNRSLCIIILNYLKVVDIKAIPRPRRVVF